jgi:GTPase Era involved in 16S rRNA processing
MGVERNQIMNKALELMSPEEFRKLPTMWEREVENLDEARRIFPIVPISPECETRMRREAQREREIRDSGADLLHAAEINIAMMEGRPISAEAFDHCATIFKMKLDDKYVRVGERYEKKP